MTNLFVFPTEKPSILHLWTDEKGTRPVLCELDYSHTRNTQNMHITSDDEIKEGDYFLSTITNQLYKCEDIISQKNVNLSNWLKKIILTTDQDLIKDGVQSIDDEFLEWFIKNPSCEEVEVEHTYISFELNKPASKYYKIILPKEEPI